MTHLLVSVLLPAFYLVSYLAFKPLTGYIVHALDPNHLIQGFSTCYIDLVLFSDTQEFEAPPLIPVTVSFSKTMKDPRYEGNDNTGGVVLCNDLDCFPSHLRHGAMAYCFAIFLLLIPPAQQQNKYTPNTSNTWIWTRLELRTVLCRYFWIFRCSKPLYHPTGEVQSRLYNKNTYVVMVQAQHPAIRHDNIFSELKVERLPLFYYTFLETHIKISSELTSPCQFQASKDLLWSDLGLINVKLAFDELYRLGQRTQCSALRWSLYNFFKTKANYESFCVTFPTGLTQISTLHSS
jgi:hypothetical protein